MQAYPFGFASNPDKVGLFLAGQVSNEKENKENVSSLRFRITLVNQHNAKDSIAGGGCAVPSLGSSLPIVFCVCSVICGVIVFCVLYLLYLATLPLPTQFWQAWLGPGVLNHLIQPIQYSRPSSHNREQILEIGIRKGVDHTCACMPLIAKTHGR
jgi:hypothetical protein